MKIIYKYAVYPGFNVVEAPKDAEILCFGESKTLAVWMLVRADEPEKDEYKMYVAATGEEIPKEFTRYVGSVHGIQGWMVVHGIQGWLVFHLFVKGR